MVSFCFAGVRWRISFGFFAGVAAFLFLDAGGFALAFLGAAALHELGHLAAMATVNAPVRLVELSASGMGILRGGRLNSRAELWILAAGPAVNLVAALLLYLQGSGGSLRFSAANTALAVFHLLPLGGLDGGSLLELLAVQLLGADRGCRWARLCSMLFALAALALLVLYAVYNGFSAGMLLLGLLLLCAVLSPKTLS